MSLHCRGRWVLTKGSGGRGNGPGRIHGRGTDVPINSVPVDQSGFLKVMVSSIEPRPEGKYDQETRRMVETGRQASDPNGVPQWTVEVVATVPGRFDSRTQSELLRVTVTCAEDPSTQVMEGEQVVFEGLTVGVMAPEVDKESGKPRGGKLFWQAQGVRSRSLAGKS
jgi:hypothetical protein